MILAYDYALIAEHCRQAANALESVLERDTKHTVPLKADDVRELRTLAEIADERCNELVTDPSICGDESPRTGEDAK